jgi:hypothetical protein
MLIIPVLFTLLEHSCGSSAPAELRPLLDELWERAMQPFDNCDMIDDSSFAVEEAEMSFFPSLSIHLLQGFGSIAQPPQRDEYIHILQT